MRILITGANGQLGRALTEKLLKEKHDFDIKLLLTVGGSATLSVLKEHIEEEAASLAEVRCEEMDITDKEAVERITKHFSPEVLINCAAYNAVDAAEEDKRAFSVNVDGVGFLAKAAEMVGAKFVHISSDYVFDGTKGEPYTEEDAVSPISAYGRSKAEGERMALSGCEKSFVIRTSWLYGDGKNFVRTIAELAKTKEEISVVADRTGCPTGTDALSDMILSLIKTEQYGIWHGVCEGEATWYDFAKEILRLAKKEVILHPICGEEYPAKAKRPAYSVLSNRRLKETKVFSMPHWKEELKKYLIKNGDGY